MSIDARADSVFLKACRGENVPHTPIWLNRQAGRYMREYHDVKGTTSSLDFFKNPDLAARVTLDLRPVEAIDRGADDGSAARHQICCEFIRQRGFAGSGPSIDRNPHGPPE